MHAAHVGRRRFAHVASFSSVSFLLPSPFSCPLQSGFVRAFYNFGINVPQSQHKLYILGSIAGALGLSYVYVAGNLKDSTWWCEKGVGVCVCV